MLMLSCMSLTACSSRQIIKTEYIKQQIPELPKEPEYYSVQWQVITPLHPPLDKGGIERGYCVDADNAKNLLKNRELGKGYQQELKIILEQIKGETK